MRAKELASLLAPFLLVCDPHSLVPDYRLLRIERERICARTAKSALDSRVSLGLPDPFSIEAKPLASIAASLPADAEVELALEDSALSWKSGSARGKLACRPAVTVTDVPEMPENAIRGSHSLSGLFQLGALSCSNQSLANMGLFGMTVLQEGEHIYALSSDNVTLAVARITRPDGLTLPNPITVSPNEIDLLVAMTGRKDIDLSLTPDAILFEDDIYYGSVSLVSPLRHDLYALCKPFLSGEHAHDIHKERVQAFVKRAYILAEAKQKTTVTVRAEDDQLMLQFNEELAQSDESYSITEGFKVPEPLSVEVDALRLGKALTHCTQMVIEHMSNNVIVFRSKDASFHYILSARNPE